MTLTPPAHICGSFSYLRGRKDPVLDERRAWVVEAYKSGYSAAQISAALGIVTDRSFAIIRQARRNGLLPADEKTAPLPEKPHDPTKRVVTFDSQIASNVTLPRLPFEAASGSIDDPRHETAPRQTLVRVSPTTERRADVAGAIAAIRRAWEARA